MPKEYTPETEDIAELERVIEEARYQNKTGLNLTDESITSLPESVGRLSNLRYLGISMNNLNSIPDSIGNLVRLQTLEMWANQLSEIPQVILNLRQLQNLDISWNKIAALPDWISQLPELKILHARGNQIKELPKCLGQLINLVIIDVSENQLTELPISFLELIERGYLQEFYLHGNDSLGIPTEIIGPGYFEVEESINEQLPEDQQLKPQDPKRIARYYRQVLAGPVRPLNEAKVLVVGPGGNGKSSLIEFLLTGEFEQGKKATEGVKVSAWEIPSVRDGETLRLNVWDFGGQELQYSTHEFFLSERAVYVLVFQNRDDLATPDGLFYWLDLIHLVAPDAPVIVAFSKQDECVGIPNGLADLQRLHPNIVGFHQISCNTKKPEAARFVENARRLREVVQETVCRELGHIRYKLPASWMAVKEQLEKPNNDYLSFADYQRLCVEQGVSDEEDQKMLADFLHDLGTMLNYADRIEWEDTHILNPEWVTQGVYALSIWKEELEATGGILSDARVRTRLSEPQFKGKYPPHAQRFILEMMLKFKLCYELKSGPQRRYLVPNALPEDPPQLVFNDDGALRFEIHFPRLLPTSIISRFIVEMHDQNIAHLWRLGLQGEMLGHTFKVTAHPKERVIRIAIAGSGPARVRVLEIIRNHFTVICREREYDQVEYTFPPRYPNAKPYPFEDLMKAERAEKEEIWLPDAGDVNVQDWLNGITIPSTRIRLQKAIKEAAERGGVYIGHLGDKMTTDKSIHATMTGDGNVIGDNNQVTVQKGDNNQAQIQKLADNPTDLKAEIAKLRDLIEQARTAGANKYVCDAAEGNVAQLEEAANEPTSKDSEEKANGALAMLEGAAKGFESYEKIGKAFQGILKLVGPALALYFKMQTPI